MREKIEHISKQERDDSVVNKIQQVLRQDAHEVQQILNTIAENPKIKNIRLGKLNKQKARPRPVLLTVDSDLDIRKLMAKSYKLKGAFEYETIQKYYSKNRK